MKNCKTFKKQLIAFLHGELNERDTQTVEAHLETCASCRTGLEAHRATLDLLGEALEAAPAPEQLSAWRTIPRRVPAHRPTPADYWYSPRSRAILLSGATFCLLFFLSLSIVVFPALKKEGGHENIEVTLTAPPVKSLSMPLKKLQVPGGMERQQPTSRLRKRIVVSKPS